MSNPENVWDFYCVLNRGKIISNSAKYRDDGGRSPTGQDADEEDSKPNNMEVAKGTIESAGKHIRHDRFTEKMTIAEYEQMWGIEGGAPTQKCIVCRSAYKIIDTGTEVDEDGLHIPVMEYDWVLSPVFSEIEPYLKDIVEYDGNGDEISRRRPIASDTSYLSGYAGTDALEV